MATISVTNDATFTTALTTAVAGDVVEVAAGTYTRAPTLDRFTPAYLFANSGSVGNLITVKAMGVVTLEATVASTGTATSGSASTLVNSAAPFVNEAYNASGGSRYAVKITSGTGSGQLRFINSNTTTTLTLNEDFAVAPDNTSVYEVIGAGPTIGGYTDRDYIKWTVDDISTDKWVINGLDNPARSDTGHVILYDTVGCTIEGVEIVGTRHYYGDNYCGVRLENADACTVKNNWISGIRHSNNTSHNGAGVMTYSAYNCVIEHNELTDSGSGINVKGESFSAQTANTLRYNFIDGCQNGIRIDFSLGAGQSYCYQNIIVNSGNGGNGINPGSDVRRWTIYSNTIYNMDSGQGIYYSNGVARTALTFRDNLISTAPTALDLSELGSLTAEDSLDYDHVHVTTRFGSFNGGNKADRATFFADTAREEHGGSSNPSFINAGAGDFHLGVGNAARTSSSTGGPVGAYITGTEEIGVQSALEEEEAPAATLRRCMMMAQKRRLNLL